MLRRSFLQAAAGAALGGAPRVIRHIEVYREENHFAGWPANHGAWSWGDELLVGFESGFFRRNMGGHAIDYRQPASHVLARSLDGGETWRVEHPDSLKPPTGQKIAGVPGEPGGKPLSDCPGNVGFTHPDFALTARMSGVDAGESRFYYSLDRGRSWLGPFRLPDFGQPGTAARTDYLINGPHDLTLFLTAAKSNGKEGRVLCARTLDGARSWKMLSFVCPEPGGREFAIMPSSVRLPEGTILTAVRYRDFIALYRSADGGLTWSYMNRPVPSTGGNPPSMLRLQDGRLALTYGYRRKPFGIRARLSSDDGRSWSDAFVLREDGGNWDLGYPRTLQRPDGKLVTVYYFNTDPRTERFIGATLWNPGAK